MIDHLQPYPNYRDSLLPWLGKIPEHWGVRRNGRLFLQRNETGFPALPILEVSLKTGVRVRDFENSTRKQVMSVRENYKHAKRGDIAYNMMRMWQRAVGVAPVDGLVRPAYVVAKPLAETDSRSRNEKLAGLMWRMNICEERGTGIDKVIIAIETHQLPAPDFRVPGDNTVAVLLASRGFGEMDRDERVRAKAYYLKEELRQLWKQPNWTAARNLLTSWYLRAQASGVRILQQFARTILGHSWGILNYCKYTLSTGLLEGTNNKIRTMQRQAYEFRDREFFKLKIYALHETRYALIG